MEFFKEKITNFKDNAIQIVIQKENLSLVFHTILPFYLLSEELDDPDCCLEINDKNEVIGLRSIEFGYNHARRIGRISINWLLKAFNKICQAEQSQRLPQVNLPVKKNSRWGTVNLPNPHAKPFFPSKKNPVDGMP